LLFALKLECRTEIGDIMDIYEEVVLNYITSDSNRFVNPQFNIEYDKQDEIGGSLPDFIVLDFQAEIVFIVEVSTAWNIDKLISKVKEKDIRWIKPLKKHFSKNTIIKDWEYRVTLFLRDERVEYAKKKLDDELVNIISLKTINSFLGNNTFESDNKL
jgi:dsDNA-specific endonuclease/ATPase MutS2